MRTRRDFLKESLAATAAVTATNALVRGADDDSGGNRRRPNILLIITDQQSGSAMSCAMGKRHIHTPAMDSLAESGTRFSRAYASNPLCMPSRNSIFTGRYPHETKVTHNARAKIDTKDFVYMGTYLKRAGYETAYFGKWHLTVHTKDKAAHGFATFGEARPGGKNDAKTAAAAAKWLAGKHDKPFLAVVSFLSPHDVCQLARGERLPCGAIGNPPSPDQCPPAPANLAPPTDETQTMTVMRKGYHASRMFPVGGFTADKWRQFRWGYYRIVEKVDSRIGEVLAALKRAGLEEDTIVIFTSDHGDCAGAHRWNQKTVFYDESACVPLIIRCKGKTGGVVRHELINTGVDILPTMLDFAGIPKPDKLTGLSLKGLALGSRPNQWRDHLVVQNDMVQAGAIDGFTPTCQGRMVRTDHYKYCIYDKGDRREGLFDMRADPLEAVNLADAPAHRQTVLDYRKILTDFAARFNDAAAVRMLADDVPARPFHGKSSV